MPEPTLHETRDSHWHVWREEEHHATVPTLGTAAASAGSAEALLTAKSYDADDDGNGLGLSFTVEEHNVHTDEHEVIATGPALHGKYDLQRAHWMPTTERVDREPSLHGTRNRQRPNANTTMLPNRLRCSVHTNVKGQENASERKEVARA